MTFHVPQLAYLDKIPRQSLISWFVRDMELLGNDSSGWVWTSSHPLLGAARFALTLPTGTRTIFMGLKKDGTEARAFFQINQLDEDQWSMSVGLSGHHSVDLPTDTLTEAMLPAGCPNETILTWTAKHMRLTLNRRTVCQVRLVQELSEDFSFSSFFTWVTARKDIAQRPSLIPLLAPVDLRTRVRRGV